MQTTIGVLLAGQALLFVAVAALGWLIRQERQARRAGEAVLAAQLAAAEGSSERFALFDRRLAVIEPIDALWAGWAQAQRPDGDGLAAALKAIERARLLFDAELGDELEKAAALLTTCMAHRDWERVALASGRRAEREALLERVTDLETRLRASIDKLRGRMAREARATG